MAEPRFTEEEFAEILRRATEMQARLPARSSDSTDVVGGAEPSNTGMSLTDIRANAAEVGIDAELVTRAAAGSHGDADMSGVGMEWRTASSELSRVLVTLEPLDGRNELRVSVDAEPVAVLSQLVSLRGGGLIGGLIGTAIGVGTVGGIALLGGAAATSALPLGSTRDDG